MMTPQSTPYFFASITMLAMASIAFGFMPLVSFFLVVCFVGFLFGYQHFLATNKFNFMFVCWMLAIVLGIVVGVYKPLGFVHPRVFAVTQLHENGLPFQLTINSAKILAGYCILFSMLPRVVGCSAMIASPLRQYLLATLFSAIVLATAYIVLDLNVYVKSIHYILLFSTVNLLATCVVEEAFMRLLLQQQLHHFMLKLTNKKYWQEAVPLFVATLVFTLTHFSFNADVLLVFALAGFLYGLIYTLTKNIAAAIAVHFIVNAVHFSLLTYPLANR